MKLKAEAAARTLGKPGSWRLALLHGPDPAGSQALLDCVAHAIGPDAERVDLEGSRLRDDPALLADEATAISLFGSSRWIRVTATGDDVDRAVDALLEAPPGCPVVVVAGQLRATSRLLKRVEAAPDLVACASYPVSGAQANGLVVDLARVRGVRLAPGVAASIAAGSGGDRGIMASALDVLALYLDASPERIREASGADLDAIGASIDDPEPARLVDAVFAGDPAAVGAELDQTGGAIIPALRALGRRSLALARIAGSGDTSRGRMPYPRDREAMLRQARSWPSDGLAAFHRQLSEVEAAVKQPGTAGEVIARYALIRKARELARRR